MKSAAAIALFLILCATLLPAMAQEPPPPKIDPDPAGPEELQEIQGVLVEEADGKPIAGAMVELFYRGRPYVDYTRNIDYATSDDQGRFLIRTTKKPERAFRIRVRSKDSVTFYTDVYGQTPGEPLRVAAPARMGWIAGQVVDRKGKRVTFGYLNVRRPSDENSIQWVDSITPDSNGFFIFGPLALGDYEVVYSFVPNSSYSFDNKPVRVKASSRPQEDDQFSDIAVDLPVIARIRVADEEGKPVEQYDLQVRANTTEGTFAKYPKVTPQDLTGGAYPFYADGGGRFVLSVCSGAGFGWTECILKTADEDPSQTVTIPFQTASAKINGHIVHSDGSPLTETRIVTIEPLLPPTQSGLRIPISFRAKTAEEGRFVSPLLPAGDYRLSVNCDSVSDRIEQNVRLEKGQTLDLELTSLVSPSRLIEGTVVDVHGKPLGGVNVSLFSNGGAGGHVLTDEQGRWRLRLADPPGDPEWRWPFQIAMSEPGDMQPIAQQAMLERDLRTVKPLTYYRRTAVLLKPVVAETDVAKAVSPRVVHFFVQPGFGIREIFGLGVDSNSVLAHAERGFLFNGFPRGVPAEIRVSAPARPAGEPVWYEDEREIARGATVTLPPDGEHAYSVRLPLTFVDNRAQFAPPPVAFIKVLDFKTGKPIEGANVSNTTGGSNGDCHTLPDGTCKRTLNPGNPQVTLPDYAIYESSQGVRGHYMSEYVQLTSSTMSSAEHPIILRALKLNRPEGLSVVVQDEQGKLITDQFTLLDGPVRYAVSPHDHRPGQGCSMHVPDAGDPIHNLVFTGGGGEVVRMKIRNHREGFCSIAEDSKGIPCLRVDFGGAPENGGIPECVLEVAR